ncbi:MAG TPA: alpha/beta hydrolase [Vicinamibacterales bacterium]|nr:alpha/beta hydrolase [Vicinamibacterales bacterium]
MAPAILLAALLGLHARPARAGSVSRNPAYETGQVLSELPEEKFVEVNHARLEYLDWGGKGQTLILLPGLGDSAHAFDRIALRFTDRFHVLALTQRGQPPSSEPPLGYDLPTLADDIWKVMQALGIARAHLAGAGVAGAEMTRLAALYPHRILSLVYLDAYDGADATEVLRGDPAPPPHLPRVSVAARVEGWWKRHPEDYSVVRCPALAIYEKQTVDPNVPDGAPEDLRTRGDAFWRTDMAAFVTQSATRFQREVPQGHAVVLDGGSGALLRDHEIDVADAMRRFYATLPPPPPFNHP